MNPAKVALCSVLRTLYRLGYNVPVEPQVENVLKGEVR
jgi:hypothetical protein